jgi:non-ribosomal peptide synthetase component E (peptide arylation enzyme)
LKEYLLKLKAYFEEYYKGRHDVTPTTIFPPLLKAYFQEFAERTVALESLYFMQVNMQKLIKLAKVATHTIAHNILSAARERE